MANRLVGNRDLLIKYGAHDSETNRKIRIAAFDVIFEICRAFLTDPPIDGSHLLLPENFSVRLKSTHVGGWFIAKVEGRMFYPCAHADICYWWVNDDGDVDFPGGQLTSLAGARVVAEHIARGWLPKVLDCLAEKHGRKAAAKLSKALGLPFEVSAS